ncbi:DUF4214 domain-containing protein [Undibacterium umbellatum]|uniref:DUF4214 domain-containing protein n=1 Tax=Undibacterium umbellatum TaxID=2762300 RepID=A0ABR6ZCB6_9BURK|nr:DUF4214 domain-containing protein [Undibacterium umbellatum]MBC3908965.1 DUF4214 domain-containing protein [Undibacterium umbellatum]
MGINASTIQKLYIAYFNRPADVAGLTYWEGQLDANKISLSGLAQSFSEQVEYVTTYGGKSTAEVVTTLYQNLFGRAPDADGLKYWATQIDTKAVNMGTAALAILNGAVPQSVDGVTIQNKLKFATDFTTSLNTQEKAASYSYAYAFEVMRGILSGVTATALPPTLVPSQPLKIAEATNGISNAERLAGMDVLVDLKGVQTSVGYKLELMNGNSSFGTPLTHVLTESEVITKKAVLHIPGGLYWGADGAKTLGLKVTDIFGNSGKVGAQTPVILDTTAPVLPGTGTYTTYWINQPPSGLGLGMGEIHYSILQGTMTGGTAAILENNTVIAKISNISSTASTLDFIIDPGLYRQVYADFNTNANLSLMLTDQAGNTTISKLNDYKIKTVLNSKIGTPATNIIISSTGANDFLYVKADINGLEYPLCKAYLKINGQVVAIDNDILSIDRTVDFNVLFANNAQIQSLINAGGVVSVDMMDRNGSFISSVDNPILGSNQFGSHTVINSTAVPPIGPSKGLYIYSYFKTATGSASGIAEIQYSIIAGQYAGGSATILENGVALAKVAYIGMNDKILDFVFDTTLASRIYDDFHFKKNLSLAITTASGQTLTSRLDDFQIGYHYKEKDGSPATGISLIPVGGTTVANTVNSSNTNLLVKATINGIEYGGKSAYLKINGQIVAIDDHISYSDTTVDFDLGATDSVQLQAIVKSGGIVSVLMVDQNGAGIESLINPYLTSNFTSASATSQSEIINQHQLMLIAPESVFVGIVGQPHLQQLTELVSV